MKKKIGVITLSKEIEYENQYKKLERLCKEIRKKAKEKNIDLSDEASPYFIDEIKESKIEPKKSTVKNSGLSKEDREELNKLRDEKSYWKSIQVKDSDHRKEALKNIGRINKIIKQKFGLNW